MILSRKEFVCVKKLFSLIMISCITILTTYSCKCTHDPFLIIVTIEELSIHVVMVNGLLIGYLPCKVKKIINHLIRVTIKNVSTYFVEDFISTEDKGEPNLLVD